MWLAMASWRSKWRLESDYDLVILDLNLPKLDGIGVLEQPFVPGKSSLPVLVLTARSRIEDRVQSLDTGADDCLTKPFSFTELSARVRALLRRGPRTVEDRAAGRRSGTGPGGAPGGTRRQTHRADVRRNLPCWNT